MEGHTKDVRTVAFSPQGLLASGSDDMSVRLWDLDYMYPTEYNDKETDLITMSPDGNYLASSSGTNIYLWDGMTGQPTEHHNLLQKTRFIMFSPDGERLVSSKDNIVTVWDVKNGTICQTFQGHTRFVYSAAFSSDGNYIASGSGDCTVRIWNWLAENKEEEAMIFRGHKNKVMTVAFSPNGQLLAGGSDTEFIIWDRTTLQLKHVVDHHLVNIKSIIFSQDSSRILLRSAYKCSVSVWDSHTGACIEGPITIESIYRYIGFDLRIPEYFLTESGAPSTLNCYVSSASQSLNGKRYGISSAGDWITYNSRKFIPLPARYKPSASWVQGNIVAIGIDEGQPVLFRFSPDEEPPKW